MINSQDIKKGTAIRMDGGAPPFAWTVASGCASISSTVSQARVTPL